MKLPKAKLHIYLVVLFCIFFVKISYALESLSYSGRLVNANGSPVTGSVNLKVELAYSGPPLTVKCSQDFTGVSLTNGVFHLKVDFDCSPNSLTDVLAGIPSGQAASIRVTDVTDVAHPKAYSYQALHAVPFSNVSDYAKQLVVKGTAADQVLVWNNTDKKWEAGTVAGASGGTVTNVSVAAPLTISNPSTTPSITLPQASGAQSGYLSSADWTTFNNKEGSIAGGTAAQYYRGDKSWQTLDTSAVAENAANLYFTNARALGVPLTGFSATSSAIVATDTVIEGFSKAQGQINTLTSDFTHFLKKDSADTLSGNTALTGVITADPVLGDIVVRSTPMGMTSAVNKSYVDSADGLKVNKAGDTITGVLTLDNDLKIKGGSNYVTVKGHASSAAYNLSLPQTAGTAGYVLSTDGSGNTTWINPSTVATGSGTVNSASITDGSIVDADVNASAAIAQSKIAGLATDLSNKQPLITAGTTSQYYRGDKTFVDLGTDVRGTQLTGYSVGANSSIAATDTTLAAFQKVQGQIDATNTAVAGKEPTLTAGSTSQYYRGDKSWQTLNGSAVANTAAGNIAATNVQSALNELDSEKQANITSASTVTTGSLYAGGEIRFYELPGNGTNYTSLKAPNALTADINYVLPSVVPLAGQVLSSDASGIMSWITLPTAPVSSAFGRTGAVTATAGDYSAALITNTAAGNIAATSVQAALNELDTEKQPLITAGTTSQYYRGDKTFVDFGTDVRGTALTGFVVGANSAVVAGDSTLAAFQKVQGQINATNTAVSGKEPAITAGTTAQYIRGDKTLSTFATDAINSALSTFALNAGAKPAVNTSDSVVGAFGKVQKYLNDINSDYVSKSANQTINGSLAINSLTGFITVPTPVNPTDAVNKSYVDSFGQWTQSGSDIYRSSGNVGIGTSSPQYPLHVIGAGNNILQLDQFSNDLIAPAIRTRKARGTQSSPSQILANDRIFGIYGNSYHDSGWATNNTVTIQGFATEAHTSTSQGTAISFDTTPSGTVARSERMRIDSNGNVGIGTTTPGFKLEVNGATATTSLKVSGNNISRYNPAMGLQLGDQDWTDMISTQSGTFVYSSVDKGIKTTGDTWFIINSRIPIDPSGVYRVTARLKKVDGTGSVYVGADSLDANFNSIKTDAENSYNYFAAQQVTVAPGATFIASGTISGHNIVGGAGDDRFDPDAKYFNVIIITNYQGTGNSIIESVEIHKIPTLEPWKSVTFQNGWGNYGGAYGTAAYFKDNNGLVNIRGLVAGGTIGSNVCIFTLPVGYRPAYRILRATQTNVNTIGRVDVAADGCVSAVTGDPAWFSLDGITFRTD